MSIQATDMTELPDAERFLPSTGTCYGKQIDSAFTGFFGQFQDSFFYANFLQFIIVTLLYMSVGKGKYWEILFYAGIAGLCGGVIENTTVAFICQESQRKKNYKVFPFLLNEIFWIGCEYAIPFLNLIKMKAFSKERTAKIINYTIGGLFIPFTIFRFAIGLERMNKGYLNSQKIKNLHGYAFGIMAIADIICTVGILYFVHRHNKRSFSTSNISDYIKHSSYTILVTVDVVGSLLSILDIITNLGMFEKYIPSTITTPFHCLKSSFVMILAVDALLFKYGASQSSINSSSSGGDTSRHNQDYSSKGYKNISTYGSSYNIDMSMNNINNINNMNNNISNKYSSNNGYKSLSKPSNITYSSYSSYSTLGHNMPTLTNKSIIKNYTKNSYSPESDSTLAAPFGFLSYPLK